MASLNPITLSSAAIIIILQVSFGLSQSQSESNNFGSSSLPPHEIPDDHRLGYGQPPTGAASCPFAVQNFNSQNDGNPTSSAAAAEVQYQKSAQHLNQHPSQMYPTPGQFPYGTMLPNPYGLSGTPFMTPGGYPNHFYARNNGQFMSGYYPNFYPVSQFPYPPNFMPTSPMGVQSEMNPHQLLEHQKSGVQTGSQEEHSNPSVRNENSEVVHHENSESTPEHLGNKRSFGPNNYNSYPYGSQYGMSHQSSGTNGPRSYQNAAEGESADSNPSQTQTGSETPSMSAGTDINSLPPQVKEFMDMIPQILDCQDSGVPHGSASRYARFIRGNPMKKMRFAPKHHYYY